MSEETNKQFGETVHDLGGKPPSRTSAARTSIGGSAGRRKVRGVTLAELMITASIGMVLMTTAVPSFHSMICNNRLAVQANDFTMVLTHARSEARKRRLTAVVCKSTDGATCTDSDRTFWEAGWLMFIDADRDNFVDSGEPILARSGSLSGGVTMRADSAFNDYIAFLPDGRGIGSGDTEPPADGIFRLCDNRGTGSAREIQVSPIGRASVDRTPGTDSCP